MEVELRDVTAEDVEVFYEQQLDPEARRLSGSSPSRATSRGRSSREARGRPWLGRAFWGKGIATAALASLLREVTERPLCARVAPSNVGSIRVLGKCGLTEIGGEQYVDEAMGGEVGEALFELR